MIRRTTTYHSTTKDSTLYVLEERKSPIALEINGPGGSFGVSLSEADEEELYDLLLERRLARAELKS